MRLAEDDRARVPFAVIGVLLLLGSTAFATTLAGRGPVSEDRSADEAVERVEANAAAALRGAVRTAARDAAREPLTRPANTSFGRVVNRSSPFRDALRIRIYLTARERLRSVRYRHRDVVARASLPPTRTPAALRAAKRRVRIEPTENGTALRVRIRDVRYTATRDRRQVASETRQVELVVATPVLALHERTRAFERRLDRDPLEGPGLGRRLTGRLYPLVWARGYAQRYGLPIENVLANRHVAVSTNGAVLASQRAAFGRSDPEGRRASRRALVRLGLRDLTAPTRLPDDWTRRVLASPNGPPDRAAPIPRFDSGTAPSPDREFVVGVNRSADAALARVLDGEGNGSLDGALRAGYRVTGRLRTATRVVESDPRPEPVEPSGDYDLIGRRVSSTATARNATAPRPRIGEGERRLVTHEREVTVDRVTAWTWVDGNRTTRTRAEWSSTYRVGVSVTVEPDRRAPGPNRSVRPAFRRGGRFDGPNLAGTPAEVRSKLVEAPGGPDEVAGLVARERLETRRVRVVGDRPAGLEPWVFADLDALADRLRNESVQVQGVGLAAGRANPPAALAERIRSNRSAIVDAPETYGGAAERARIAARATYVNAVLAALDRRAAARDERTERLDEVLAESGAGSGERVLRTYRAGRGVTRPQRRVTLRGPIGPVRPTPDASPAYLTVTSVKRERVDAVPPGEGYHPLAARNRNLFAPATGDVVDRVAGTSRGSVDLATAGRTLVAAGRIPDDRTGEGFEERTERLDRETGKALRSVQSRAMQVVQERTVLGGSTALTAVREATERWNGTGRQALAATNGSLADAIAAEAVERVADPKANRTDRLALHLGLAIGEVVRGSDARVSERVAEETQLAARRIARRALVEAGTRGASAATDALRARWARGVLKGVPAGFPVEPVPGYWYATTNVWTVRVRGAYARFTLRTRRGAPGESLRYVRDGSTVSLDVDGDGEAERLGYDERVAFQANTTVVVAVPPYGGVGDVGSDADERSAGSPRPACLGPTVACPDHPE